MRDVVEVEVMVEERVEVKDEERVEVKGEERVEVKGEERVEVKGEERVGMVEEGAGWVPVAAEVAVKAEDRPHSSHCQTMAMQWDQQILRQAARWVRKSLSRLMALKRRMELHLKHRPHLISSNRRQRQPNLLHDLTQKMLSHLSEMTPIS